MTESDDSSVAKPKNHNGLCTNAKNKITHFKVIVIFVVRPIYDEGKMNLV